jgi:hypothetical protein
MGHELVDRKDVAVPKMGQSRYIAMRLRSVVDLNAIVEEFLCW